MFLLVAAALAGALLLLPAEATAGHSDMSAASGQEDPGGPDVATAVHRPRMFYDFIRPTTFHFTVDHDEPTDVVVTLVKTSSGEVVRRWERQDVPSGEMQQIRWKGVSGGRLLDERRYAFRLTATDNDGDATSSAASSDSDRDALQLWHHRFPVRGPHQYWDGFGAGRNHQGTDVGAACGERLVAARGGRVQYAGYHYGAGYYLVIDGKKTGIDYVYMHLQAPALPAAGDRVRTGETIGRVGETGNASGCHLHFELWSAPGWYEGGSAFDSEPSLRHWDSYS